MQERIIENTISNIIETQFPSLYRDEQTIFVEFIKQYYKWLESSGRALYYTRNLLENQDIDSTAEEFIVYFKEKYLKNIQFETQTNTRQLLKHTLDLYRSKGTARAIDLLFKLVFGVSAEVYEPGKDIFKLSSGSYYKQKYLEINLHEEAHKLSGLVVKGHKSNATAYVESVVRKKINGRLRDVLYISDLVGEFSASEFLIIPNNTIISNKRIFVLGSLNYVSVPATGISSGYKVGDGVKLQSLMGTSAIGLVTKVTETIGTIDFNIIDGGYGFTTNSQVLISERVLNLANVVVSNSESKNYFELFNSISQPSANINIVNANGDFSNGESIFTYYANGDVKGEGIISRNYIVEGESNGVISVVVLSGDLNESYYYTSGNTIVAELNVLTGYEDTTTTANIIGISKNVVISYTDNVGAFTENDIIYQVNNNDEIVANGTILLVENIVGANGDLTIINTTGVFTNNFPLKIQSKFTTANLSSISLRIGVIDIDNPFDFNDSNFIISNSIHYSTTAKVLSQSIGSGADFNVGSLIYEENVLLNSDNLSDYANLILNDEWSFPSGNFYSNAIISDVLSYSNTEIGRILTLTNINPGSGYNYPPFILVYEPETYRFQKKDKIIHIEDVTRDFEDGEIITQNSANAMGIIKEHGSYTYKGTETNYILVQGLKFDDEKQFELSTSNTETLLFGTSSGAEANATLIYDVYTENNYMGINSQISGNVSTSTGAIQSIKIVDSGYGFKQGESIEIRNNSDIVGFGTGYLMKHGTSIGKYLNTNGFLSHHNKLFDGLYYQEYSYDIRSSVVLNKYEEMLKRILHVAGTKYFSSFVYTENINIDNSVDEVIISTEEQV